MQEININVRVTLGLTEQLAAAVECAVRALTAPKSHGAPAAPAPSPAVAEEPQNAPAAAAPQLAAPAPAAAAEREWTAEDVRAAMDAARRRIEGEDYATNTDGDGYKLHHRALTSQFRTIAQQLGAEKPSALPDSESRRKFCAVCGVLTVMDGRVVEPTPF